MDIFLNTLYTSSYVGSLFVLRSARTGGARIDPATGQPLTRDSPNVLRARLVGVGISALTSLLIASGIASQTGYEAGDARKIAQLLGLWKPYISLQEGLQLVALPLGCTASLFAGPLLTSALDGRLPGMKRWSWRFDIVGTLTSLTGLRNYIVVRAKCTLLYSYHPLIT